MRYDILVTSSTLIVGLHDINLPNPDKGSNSNCDFPYLISGQPIHQQHLAHVFSPYSDILCRQNTDQDSLRLGEVKWSDSNKHIVTY